MEDRKSGREGKGSQDGARWWWESDDLIGCDWVWCVVVVVVIPETRDGILVTRDGVKGQGTGIVGRRRRRVRHRS